jgi:hypothetical protein
MSCVVSGMRSLSTQELVDVLAAAYVFTPIFVGIFAVTSIGFRRLIPLIRPERKSRPPIDLRFIIQTTVLCSALLVLSRYLVSFLENLPLFPADSVWHIRSSEYTFLTSSDSLVANLLAIRFMLFLAVPYFLMKFYEHLAPLSDRPLGGWLKATGIVIFYVAACVGSFVYPLIVIWEFGGVQDGEMYYRGMRYSERATTFMLAVGFVFTAWFLCGLLGYLRLSSSVQGRRHRRLFTLTAVIGTIGFLLLYKMSSSSPLNATVSAVVILGMFFYWIGGNYFMRLCSRFRKD